MSQTILLPNIFSATDFMMNACKNQRVFPKQDYSKARPVRRWSRIEIATTPAARNDFFQTVTQITANIPKMNSFGDVFLLIHDIRVMLFDKVAAVGIPTLELNNLINNSYLNFRIEDRPVVKNEPLHLYTVGNGIEAHITQAFAGAAGTDLFHSQPGNQAGVTHHDWAVYMPDMQAQAWIDVDTAAMGADSLTAAVGAQLILWGWEWSQPSAA